MARDSVIWTTRHRPRFPGAPFTGRNHPQALTDEFPAWKSRKGFRWFPGERSKRPCHTASGKSPPLSGWQSLETSPKAIQSGKISAEKDAHGQWRIEPSELHRIYPPVHSPGASGTASDAGSEGPVETIGNPNGTSLLQQEIRFLREKLADQSAQITDLRGERDRLLLVIETQATNIRNLTDQRPSPAPASEPPPKPKGGAVCGDIDRVAPTGSWNPGPEIRPAAVERLGFLGVERRGFTTPQPWIRLTSRG